MRSLEFSSYFVAHQMPDSKHECHGVSFHPNVGSTFYFHSPGLALPASCVPEISGRNSIREAPISPGPSVRQKFLIDIKKVALSHKEGVNDSAQLLTSPGKAFRVQMSPE